MLNTEKIAGMFLKLAAKGEFATLRMVSSYSESISVRSDVLAPVGSGTDSGYMITVYSGDGSGYAASTDFSEKGLEQTFEKARIWANFNKTRSVVPFSKIEKLSPSLNYSSPVEIPWEKKYLKDKIEYLKMLNRNMSAPNIADRSASLNFIRKTSTYMTSENGMTVQNFDFIIPYLSLTAAKDGAVQRRSLDSFAMAMQGGIEVFEKTGFNPENAKRLAVEANELLDAQNCPFGKMDLLLDPGQMVLQIHESIGHPLEIDRILGDERNYAGTSFVTLDMIGSFRYGSDLLNITFDPTVKGEFATYAADDDGFSAQKEFLIEKGILKRALGSGISQARGNVPGVSNSRASSWNRPPVDRMANLNMEPGTSSFKEMVSNVEKGVFMKTNLSWSIDDSRNKFQFGCEWGQLIENGKLTKLVKNPNYRGISRYFWNNLKMVGNIDTFEMKGVPNCGKAEPNQAIFVGHASPVCLFSDVEVFGGE
ncbi:MAG TPA: TldD/PmbA family protein [bacterium]|nr:TldD/PmbA family protein [bacterium]